MFDVAIISARGGSVRLPGKNIRPLADVPMIGWTIRAALRSEVFGQVVVSTDDERIAAVARHYGAAVPFVRPAELATDAASSDDVIAHAVAALGHRGAFALLQPTSPFRSAKHIREAAELYRSSGQSGLVAVTSTKPLHWLYHYEDNGNLTSLFPRHRRETMNLVTGQLVLPNGSIYMTDVETFERLGRLPSRNLVGYHMGEIDSIDIDEEEEFAIAEALAASGVRKIDQ